jgi:hypothetical protein
MEDLEAAINERYSQWAFPHNSINPAKLWRVDSEHFSIQLGSADEELAKKFGVQIGSKTVIYLAWQPTQCNAP